MPFKDWNDLAKNDLVLPIGGHEYTIPPLGYLDEITIKQYQQTLAESFTARSAAAEAGEEVPPLPETMDDETYLKMVLGGALKQMRDDNIPSVAILHAASVAHTAALYGREAAEQKWELGLDPEALAATMAALADPTTTVSPKASTRSPSTASANATRSRASTTATNSRKATPRKATAAKKAPRSRGTTSSRKPT